MSRVRRSPVRWGVLGPGMIAVERTIPAIVASDVADLAAIASRDAARGARIASAWPGCGAYASYDALLADSAIAMDSATARPTSSVILWRKVIGRAARIRCRGSCG